MDRLLSNTSLSLWELSALWVPLVLGQRTQALVDYVVRFPQCITVTSEQGECRKAADWVPEAG